MKKLGLFISLFLITAVAYAAISPEKIRKNELQLGIDGSTADKIITMDVGDGAANPKVIVSNTSKDFSFTKLIKTIADTIGVGDGDATGDQCLEFDTGDAGSNKKVCILDTTKDAKINVDGLIMGNGSAADQEFVIDIGLGASNPRIKWDDATGKLTFSNDGSTFKPIGSGGGAGGINQLEENNFDCETGDPPIDYTSTGGTFVSETTNPGFDSASCSWNASATTQFVRTVAPTIFEGLQGRSCSARIQYKWNGGTPGDLTWKVETSAGVFIAGAANGVDGKDLAPSSIWAEDTLFFTCPSSGDYRIEFESTADAALLLFDNVELGKVGFTNVNQTVLVANASYTSTTNCVWTRTNVAFGVFGTDVDCPAITVIQSTFAVNTSDDDLPTLKFDNLPEGNYLLEVISHISGTVVSATMALKLHEVNSAVSVGECGASPVDTSDIVNLKCTGAFSFSTSGAREFTVFGLASSGTLSIFNSADGREITFTLWKVPVSAAEAITLETVGGEFTANHANDCAFSRTAAGLGEFLVDASCTFTSTSNGIFSSVVSDNIAGDKKPGLIISANRTGTIFMCGSSPYAITGAGAAGFASLEMFFDNGSGDTAVTALAHRINGSADNMVWPYTHCGNIPVQPGQTTRVFMKAVKSATGTMTIDANGASATIHWNGHVISEQFPTPVFTDLTTSLGLKLQSNASNQVTESVTVSETTACVSSPCTISRQSGSWLTDVTRGSTGIYTLNFAIAFGSAPTCVVGTGNGNTLSRCTTNGATTTTTAPVACHNTSTGAVIDSNFNVICYGLK